MSMNRSRRRKNDETVAEPTAKAGTDRSRGDALSLWQVERIQCLSTDELVAVQAVLRHGDAFGLWCTPPEWLTLKQRTPSRLRIDLQRLIERQLLTQLDAEEREHPALAQWLHQGVLAITRVLVLLRCAGLAGRSRSSPLAPSSLLGYAQVTLPQLVACALARALRSHDGLPDDVCVFGQITTAQALDAHAASGSWTRAVLSIQDRLRRWKDAGLWSDTFCETGASAIDDLRSGKSRDNSPLPDSEEWKPLPDDYASLLANRSLWLMREMAPNLVRLAPQFAHMYAEVETLAVASSMSATTAATVRSRRAGRLMQSFTWRDSRGQTLEQMPFRMALTGTSAALGWLPRTQRDFFDLMAYVQTAHQIIVALTMGPRESELLAMTLDCLQERTVDGETCYVVRSDTFKTVAAHEGETREWPVVRQVKDAVDSQKRMMAQLDAIKRSKNQDVSRPDTLWGRFYLKGNAEDAFVQTNTWLRKYVEALGMDPLPSGQSVCSHRLRKTLARVVALALVDSPMVLFEIFGHRSIEMTLHYILANSDLRREIESIAMEIGMMRATEVVEAMAQTELRRLAGEVLPGERYGGAGGPAAARIDAFVVQELTKVHARGEEWGTDNAIDAARLFTNSGRQWMLVREGVICTKSPGAAGPCSYKAKGRQEPSKCSSKCDHRLELRFQREDVRAVLTSAVRGYEQAIADDEAGLAAYWGAQIENNIARFEDIKHDFMGLPSIAAYFALQTAESAA